MGEYIGQWDMKVLEDGEVWSTAVSQIFFSLSVCFGVMVAYGAACPRSEPAMVNAIVVGISNSLFSFVSGFAVFAALGHLAVLTDQEVKDLNFTSFGLVFGSWPVALGTLPGGEHWVRLLFFNLFLLGIDLAFSLVEAPLSVIMDKAGFKTPKWMVCAVICTICYLCSLLYTTDAGLFFLDVVDYYINFTLLLVGLFETFSAGWIFGIEEQVKKFGIDAVLTYMFANFLSFFAASCIWFYGEEGNVWGGFVALIVVYLFFFFMTAYHLNRRAAAAADGSSVASLLYDLAFGNVFYLADEMSKVVGVLPKVWAILIKHIPQILLILFINLVATPNDEGESNFGHYGLYDAWPYQTIGIVSVVLALIIVLVGFFVPDLFTSFDETSTGSIKAIDYSNPTSDEGGEEEDGVVAYAEGIEKGDVEEAAPVEECEA